MARMESRFPRRLISSVTPSATKAAPSSCAPHFDNKDLVFLPGQLVNVTVELDKIPSAVVVPHDALNEGPQGQFVYVVENGKARQQPVKVLFDDANSVAIDGNLKPGDKVIVEGQLRVDPGGAVTVVGAPPPVSVNLGSARIAGRRRADSGTGARRSAMNISRQFIERPVMTTLLMAALVIFGIFGYFALPVSELPNVDFPTIRGECAGARRRSRHHGFRGCDARWRMPSRRFPASTR